MNKFKAGDKVYYPFISDKVLTVIYNGDDPQYPIQVNGFSFTFTVDGRYTERESIPSLIHATPKNHALIEELYGIKLEAPPAKPTSREIIQAMLDIKKLPVPCWASNIDEQPSSINKWVFIDKVVDSNYPFVGRDDCHWKFAIPFDPTTLQPITELPE